MTTILPGQWVYVRGYKRYFGRLKVLKVRRTRCHNWHTGKLETYDCAQLATPSGLMEISTSNLEHAK